MWCVYVVCGVGFVVVEYVTFLFSFFHAALYRIGCTLSLSHIPGKCDQVGYVWLL